MKEKLKNSNELEKALEPLLATAGEIETAIGAAKQKLTRDFPADVARLEAEVTATGDEQKLRELRTAKDRLELQPAIVAKLERELKEVAKAIQDLINSEVREIRNKARERLTEIRANYTLELGQICGRDPVKTKTVIETLLANSDAQRWFSQVEIALVGNTPAAKAGSLLKLRAAFDEKKPLTGKLVA